jgi:hypothetical protein
MNRLGLRLAAAIAGLLATAGCSESVMELAIGRDGSAVLTMASAAHRDELARVRPMLPAFQAMGFDTSLADALWAAQDPNAALPREAFENFAKQWGGTLRLDRLERFTLDSGAIGVRAIYRAPDVRALQWTPQPGRRDRLRFEFVGGKSPIFKIVPEIEGRSNLGQPASRSIRALDGWIASALDTLRARVVVRVDGVIKQTGARRRAGDRAIVLAEFNGHEMNLDTVMRIGRVRTLGDAHVLSLQPAAGVFLESPARPIIIRFE